MGGTLTPPAGWQFAWLDELPLDAPFRFHRDDKDRTATGQRRDRPHSLVLVPLVCPTCNGSGLAAADGTTPTCPGGGQERVTSPGGYDPPGPEGMCPVCEEVVPVDDGLVEDHPAADGTTPTQPDDVLWEGETLLAGGMHGTDVSRVLPGYVAVPPGTPVELRRVVATPATE